MPIAIYQILYNITQPKFYHNSYVYFLLKKMSWMLPSCDLQCCHLCYWKIREHNYPSPTGRHPSFMREYGQGEEACTYHTSHLSCHVQIVFFIVKSSYIFTRFGFWVQKHVSRIFKSLGYKASDQIFLRFFSQQCLIRTSCIFFTAGLPFILRDLPSAAVVLISVMVTLRDTSPRTKYV